jgi:hypothetical protein
MNVFFVQVETDGTHFSSSRYCFRLHNLYQHIKLDTLGIV